MQEPHFSGHETFPIRQMWLKKVYERADAGYVKKAEFSNDESIAIFGVGKNMVSSIKHWALACGVLEEGKDASQFSVSSLWASILDDNGMDPYCENANTTWLAHWRLAGHHPGKQRSTTIWWMFNHLTSPIFTTQEVIKHLNTYANKSGAKVSDVTLKRDVETSLRGYCPKVEGGIEDIAEPMLAELGLILNEGNGAYSFRRGMKSTLSDAMFVYALMEFWEAYFKGESTLSFEAITYEVGSPGRVFKMDENAIAERLDALEEITKGNLSWVDTTGLKQVSNNNNYTVELAAKALLGSYGH